MAKLSAEAKVGLLVLGSSVILLWMTMMVGKFEFGKPSGYRVSAVFDTISGLDIKAAVRMAGVQIGTVETVELEDSKAKVVLRIDPDVKIPRGTEAAVKTMGLLGDRYVDLVPPAGRAEGAPAGKERAPFYQDGERIERSIASSDADQLIGKLSAIADDIKETTASLRQVFGGDRGTRSMEDILADLRTTMANIREFSHTLNNDGGELITRLNELVASLNDVVGENRENLRASLENVREASKSAELALASIEDAAKKVGRGEGTLGKLVHEDGLYTSIDNAAKGLSEYVGKIESLRTTLSFRNEYLFPESKSYFELMLKPKEDKYYILGVNTDTRYQYTQGVSSSAPPGSTVTYENYTDRLRFTALFAKRWGELALRLGLMESKGGLGVDYFAFNDDLKFSIDAWDANSREPENANAKLKGTATYYYGKTLFVNAGYDNALNSKRAKPFFGIGLRFDDDDLKYILGSVPVPGN